MSLVTSHVLDATTGEPAAQVPVRLERLDGSLVAAATSDDTGRVGDLGPDDLPGGVYRLVLDSASYFRRRRAPTFYPEVVVTFSVTDTGRHYHLPVLLSPFGYTTYRGS
ncbi:MAG: hydroxyisourate hydrolase [Actinomycetota bacterium]